ncbi:unnamed protein product [Mytilus edulis]|uniref:Endonuclease/exonuclease/phosphatase domain-containing protein n=1 Tax=Mytilus edulis TaxID=6550 RepID=A0A8S3R844_MYTED|nr:unnamed protein product [Mytilus edulis]
MHSYITNLEKILSYWEIVKPKETHCSFEDSLSLPGFKSVNLIRPKSKRTNKRSGGLSILVKNEIKSGVKFLEHSNNDYIWLKLSSSLFNLPEDIYLCFIFDPPENSSYTHSLNEDIFDLIEKDIAMYSTLGKIVLAGDLNARTGSGELDFIDNDSQDNLIPLYDNYNPDYDISVRHSKDVHLSTRGKLLNDICVQTGLRILNGRTRGDFIGQLTCHNPRGSSVVDYFIVSEELLDKVAFFKVHDFLADLSDHSQVSIMLNIDMKVPVLDIQSEHSQITPPKYIWNDESVLQFQTALTSNDMQEKISKFMSDDSDSQNMTLKLNDIICEAADKSLKQILPKTPNSVKSNTKTIKKQPKWFDFSLIKMRKQLDDKEKLFKKYNNDPIVRGNFFSFLKLYRKTRKNKYKQFRKDLVVQLDNMRDNNPSQYWALLQSLSNESSTKGDTSNISNSDWLHYFKKLNSNSLPVNKELIDSLNKLEKHNIFTELDYKITEKEINEAVKSLKNNKSSSFDSIINEMLKCSQSFLLKCFNTIEIELCSITLKLEHEHDECLINREKMTVKMDNLQFSTNRTFFMDYLICNGLRSITPLSISVSNICIKSDLMIGDDVMDCLAPFIVLRGLDPENIEGIELKQLEEGIFFLVASDLQKFKNVRALDLQDCNIYLQEGNILTEENLTDITKALAHIKSMQKFRLTCTNNLLEDAMGPLDGGNNQEDLKKKFCGVLSCLGRDDIIVDIVRLSYAIFVDLVDIMDPE